MKLILITDLHVGKPTDETYGIDVRQNFLDILSEVKLVQPEHLIIAGDLSLDVGDATIYAWMKVQLDALSIPYDMIVGNHDDSMLLAEAFGREADVSEGVLFYKKIIADWTCLFLDTGVKALSGNQLRWLDQELSATDGKVLIFMHHPPLEVGVPFMDIHHSLDNQAAVQEILFKQSYQIPIFVGHYHVEKTVFKRNVIVQVTPSCYFQIDQENEAFNVDHCRIAYRELTLGENDLRTTVHYFDGNLLK